MKKKKPHTHTSSNVSVDFLKGLPFSQQDWEKTPKPVQDFIINVMNEITSLNSKIEKIERRLNQDSSNSSKPPSLDSPYDKKPDKKKKQNAGGKKGHKGHSQAMLSLPKQYRSSPKSVHVGILIFQKLSHTILTRKLNSQKSKWI